MSERRELAAIMFTDIVGYTALMAADEHKALKILEKQRALLAPLISDHGGSLLKEMGDGTLTSFRSAVDAVNCALTIQKTLSGDREYKIRIGIHLGEVVIKDGDVFGDGVNVASRIEPLATPGGICISEPVYENIRNKPGVSATSMGPKALKNVPKLVEVFAISGEGIPVPPRREEKHPGDPAKAASGFPVGRGVAAAAALAVATVLLAWYYYSQHVEPAGEPTSLVLPAKPSIAVLPFANMSNDPEQEYFSDGITNDIITDLSRFPELSVIAHNTVFTYKGTSVDVTEVAERLNVRYVLEGSVQRAGEKVRINAQLIDGETGRHLWGDRYEKNFKDLFALQSELVQGIVTKMALQIDESERARAMRKDTESLEAYDYLLRGWDHFYRYTHKDNRNARAMFEGALELDPRYSTALAALAWTYIYDFLFGWTQFPDMSLERASEFARDALSIQETNYLAHTALGYVYLRRAQYELAIGELQRSIQLNPNDAESQNRLGSAMLYSGQPQEAARWKESALRLDPQLGPGTFMVLGQAYYLLGEYDKAITTLEAGLAKDPNQTGNHLMLAAASAQAGLPGKAERSAAAVRRLDPFFEMDSYGTLFRNPEDRDKIIDGLRKAGLE